jgi:hypothetical protein
MFTMLILLEVLETGTYRGGVPVPNHSGPLSLPATHGRLCLPSRLFRNGTKASVFWRQTEVIQSNVTSSAESHRNDPWWRRVPRCRVRRPFASGSPVGRYASIEYSSGTFCADRTWCRLVVRLCPDAAALRLWSWPRAVSGRTDVLRTFLWRGKPDGVSNRWSRSVCVCECIINCCVFLFDATLRSGLGS